MKLHHPFTSEVWNSFKSEVAYAVNDIRQKVVEQGWFGQPVTPRVLASQRDLEAFYGTGDKGDQAPSAGGIEAPKIEAPEIGAADGEKAVSEPPAFRNWAEMSASSQAKETPVMPSYTPEEVAANKRAANLHLMPADEKPAAPDIPLSDEQRAEQVAQYKRAANLYLGSNEPSPAAEPQGMSADERQTFEAMKTGMMERAGGPADNEPDRGIDR